MKVFGIIIHSSIDLDTECVIAEFAAMIGVLTYRLGNISLLVDFDKNTVDVIGLRASQYTWEPTLDDLAYHQLDFGLYIEGEL